MSTQLAIIPQQYASFLPALPEEMRVALINQFAPALDSFGGSFNRLSIKSSVFRLIEGGVETPLQERHMDIVIVGIAPEQYNVWYEDQYDEHSDNIKPTAIWAQGEAVPANVPASALEKRPDGRNQYAVRRRVVIARYEMQKDGTMGVDFTRLFAWDVNAVSTFGPAETVQGMTLAPLGAYVNGLKASGLVPGVIVTRIIFDVSKSVPTVRFQPVPTTTGQPLLLDSNQIQGLFAAINGTELPRLLDWRQGMTQAAPQATAPQATAPQATAPAPQATAPVQQTVVAAAQQVAQQVVVEQQQQVVQQAAQQVAQQVVQPTATTQEPVIVAPTVEATAGLATQMTAAVQQSAPVVAQTTTAAPTAAPTVSVTQDKLSAMLGDDFDE